MAIESKDEKKKREEKEEEYGQNARARKCWEMCVHTKAINTVINYPRPRSKWMHEQNKNNNDDVEYVVVVWSLTNQRCGMRQLCSRCARAFRWLIIASAGQQTGRLIEREWEKDWNEKHQVEDKRATNDNDFLTWFYCSYLFFLG